MYAVFMAGGSGTRFWPMSRRRRPKQLLKIVGDQTMMQATVNRIRPIIPPENMYVVTGADLADDVRRQVPDIPAGHILTEPIPRNTAPCVGLAAITIRRHDPHGTMIVLPADHVIREERRFLELLTAAARVAAERPFLVTLGIVPDRPETGYGYIRKGEKTLDMGEHDIFRVAQFVEKPDLERARQYVSSGAYLWNSGMFVWRVEAILDNIRRHLPLLFEGLEKIAEGGGNAGQNEILRTVYQSLTPVSIDYGVMEKTMDAVVIPCDCGWNDVGSWASLGQILPKDDAGNTSLGQFVSLETTNTIAVAPDKLVAAIGLDNLVIIDTADVLLVCPKDRAQEVKWIVEHLGEKGLEKYL